MMSREMRILFIIFSLRRKVATETQRKPKDIRFQIADLRFRISYFKLFFSVPAVSLWPFKFNSSNFFQYPCIIRGVAYNGHTSTGIRNKSEAAPVKIPH